jgi:hypothetical protein
MSATVLIIVPLTPSMELSITRGTNSCAATQELASIMWNTNVQYSDHKNPPVVFLLSPTSPVHPLLSLQDPS